MMQYEIHEVSLLKCILFWNRSAYCHYITWMSVKGDGCYLLNKPYQDNSLKEESHLSQSSKILINLNHAFCWHQVHEYGF